MCLPKVWILSDKLSNEIYRCDRKRTRRMETIPRLRLNTKEYEKKFDQLDRRMDPPCVKFKDRLRN